MNYFEEIQQFLKNASKEELERVFWFLLGYIGRKEK